MIRVGNREYERCNRSYGLTTLRRRHVQVDGAALRFHFKGKSGKVWRLDVQDRRVAKIIRACQHLPGQHLFGYLDATGKPQSITSADVNAYLRRITGRDITAKDFRTWNATVLAADALASAEPSETLAQAKGTLTAAIKAVAARLGNTPTVCRASYIHPEVIRAFLAADLRFVECRGEDLDEATSFAELPPNEARVARFLRRRLRLLAPAATATPG